MTDQQTSETQWFIAREGKQHGPLSEIEMRTFVAHSYLRATDLIWRPGMPEWLVATMVFPQAFQQTAPAPATPPQPNPQSAPQHAPSHPTTSGTVGRPGGQMGQPGSNSPGARPSGPPPGGQGSMPRQASSGPSMQSHVAMDQPRYDSVESEITPRRGLKRITIAATALAVIGGGAFALASYHEPLSRIVGAMTSSDIGPTVDIPQIAAPATNGTAATAATTAAPTTTATPSSNGNVVATVPGLHVELPPAPGGFQTAALPPEPTPQAPPSIEGSQIDAKLQKIPAWAMIKADFKDWYVGHIAAAEKMVTENKSPSEVAQHLAQGLVTLRRENAQKALAASPEKLETIARSFLETLRSLRSQSVTACYGFISKGEASPAIVQLMENPETATTFNAQIAAIFDAISEGNKKPILNDAAVKADYDVLIKELGKLGWKEEDLQVFSNPRLLSQREPEQVCKMVQDWFVAHLAVQEPSARKRLLFETLKPVVSG